MEIREVLKSGMYYHLSTRANGTDSLFRDPADYNYFIRKMDVRLCEAWEILAFTLLPSEIHLVIKVVKDQIDGEQIDHSMLLSHLLNGYVQHYNYKYSRTGSLLNRSFRRERISAGNELRETICKVHNLPVAQELVESPEHWVHSSYQNSPRQRTWGAVRFSDVLHFFDNHEEFESQHRSESMIQRVLNPRRVWIRILSPLEIEFRKYNPLGVHRWCKRSGVPP